MKSGKDPVTVLFNLLLHSRTLQLVMCYCYISEFIFIGKLCISIALTNIRKSLLHGHGI